MPFFKTTNPAIIVLHSAQKLRSSIGESEKVINACVFHWSIRLYENLHHLRNDS